MARPAPRAPLLYDEHPERHNQLPVHRKRAERVCRHSRREELAVWPDGPDRLTDVVEVFPYPDLLQAHDVVLSRLSQEFRDGLYKDHPSESRARVMKVGRQSDG